MSEKQTENDYACIQRWLNHAERCNRNSDYDGERVAVRHLRKRLEKLEKKVSAK